MHGLTATSMQDSKPERGQSHETSATYRIDGKRQLLVLTYVGRILVDDILDLLDRVKLDPKFHLGLALLIDGINADTTGLVAEDLQRVARSTPLPPSAPRAIVTPPGVAYGIARMFAAYAELFDRNLHYNIFTDADEAMTWLASVRSPRSRSEGSGHDP